MIEPFFMVQIHAQRVTSIHNHEEDRHRDNKPRRRDMWKTRNRSHSRSQRDRKGIPVFDQETERLSVLTNELCAAHSSCTGTQNIACIVVLLTEISSGCMRISEEFKQRV